MQGLGIAQIDMRYYSRARIVHTLHSEGPCRFNDLVRGGEFNRKTLRMRLDGLIEDDMVYPFDSKYKETIFNRYYFPNYADLRTYNILMAYQRMDKKFSREKGTIIRRSMGECSSSDVASEQLIHGLCKENIEQLRSTLKQTLEDIKPEVMEETILLKKEGYVREEIEIMLMNTYSMGEDYGIRFDLIRQMMYEALYPSVRSIVPRNYFYHNPGTTFTITPELLLP